MPLPPTPLHPMPLFEQLNHRHISCTASTNSQLIDELKAAKLDPRAPHLLTADSQSAGRGQHGRSWQSPKGNVYLSLYLPMTAPMTGLLSLVVGYELAKMPLIEQLNTQRQPLNLPTVGVKWANDLGFYGLDKNPQGHLLFNKLAGILIEPVWQSGKLLGGVIGVGMNITTTPRLTAQTLEGMSYQAVSLADLWMRAESSVSSVPSLSTVYEQIAQALLTANNRFEQIAAMPQLIEDFLPLFAQVDALAGHRIQVSQQIKDSVETVSGKAEGIDQNGCLQLRFDDATLTALFTGRIDVLETFDS